jgi:hypothetical protein
MSRVIPCGWIDGRTDMKKLIVALLCNFAKASKTGMEYSEG